MAGSIVYQTYRDAATAAYASSAGSGGIGIKSASAFRQHCAAIELKMRQIPDFGDERNKGWCVFCGGPEETRDHVPSKVLLEAPYPDNLPVIPSCNACNLSFSLDEEYLACLIACVIAGSVESACAVPSKAAKTLNRKPQLAARLAEARTVSGDKVIWQPEHERVRNVVVKLARGHIAYEQNEPQLDQPASVSLVPFCVMSEQERISFEQPVHSGLWPEVGSRSMHRVLLATEPSLPWIEVQNGRYRYLTDVAPMLVRMAIAEYLAAEVVWD